MTIIDRFLTLCGAPEGEIPCDAYDTAVMAVPFLEAQAATIQEQSATIVALREALVKCAIPLEALNIDNHVGAKWMCDDVKTSVAEAVVTARKALKASGEKP